MKTSWSLFPQCFSKLSIIAVTISSSSPQILLNPVSIKSIDITDQTYEEHQSLVMDFHDTPVAGHKGVKATFNTLRKHYTWKGMKEQIQTYVKHCQKCQQSKVLNQKTSGSLLLLPVPEGPWLDVTMDFTKMLESLGYNYVLVVVNRFSKKVVFVPVTVQLFILSYHSVQLYLIHLSLDLCLMLYMLPPLMSFHIALAPLWHH